MKRYLLIAIILQLSCMPLAGNIIPFMLEFSSGYLEYRLMNTNNNATLMVGGTNPGKQEEIHQRIITHNEIRFDLALYKAVKTLYTQFQFNETEKLFIKNTISSTFIFPPCGYEDSLNWASYDYNTLFNSSALLQKRNQEAPDIMLAALFLFHTANLYYEQFFRKMSVQEYDDYVPQGFQDSDEEYRYCLMQQHHKQAILKLLEEEN